MELNVEKGLTYVSEWVVTEALSARNMGSGTLDVLATPALAALMENAAMNAVAQYLPEGCTTLGTELSIRHLRATPVGQRVSATARLVEADGRRLVFRVEASDGAGPVGEGTHTRFVVETEKFLGKLKKEASL